MNCRKCHIELTKETLSPCKDYPSGYRTICRNCYRLNRRIYKGRQDQTCPTCNNPVDNITSKGHCSAHCRFIDSYKIQENGCWIWKKNITERDQPFFNFKHRRFQAKRYSLGLVKLTKFGKDVVVNTCDNFMCVNPKHLIKSTAAIEQSKRRKTLTKKQIEKHKKFTIVQLDGDEAMQKLLDDLNKTLGE